MSAEDKMFNLDQRAIRRAFAMAAETYDEVAALQREVGSRMLERLDFINSKPEVILDLGAGTGEHTVSLARRFPRAKVIGLDLAEPMLKKLRKRSSWRRPLRAVCADMQALPFADNSIDLIYSNLALQWSPSLDKTFAEFRRVLRTNGFVLFSTFGPDTLCELRASWLEADAGEHVHHFVDMHDIGDAVLRSGLAEPVMDVESFTLTYKDVYALMRELKALGAHNVTINRTRGLTGRGLLRTFEQAYEKYRVAGLLPVSYEVVYGHAWVVSDKHSASISIDSLLGAK